MLTFYENIALRRAIMHLNNPIGFPGVFSTLFTLGRVKLRGLDFRVGSKKIAIFLCEWTVWLHDESFFDKIH